MVPSETQKGTDVCAKSLLRVSGYVQHTNMVASARRQHSRGSPAGQAQSSAQVPPGPKAVIVADRAVRYHFRNTIFLRSCDSPIFKL